MVSRRHLRLLLPFWVAALIIGSFLPAEMKQAIGTQSLSPEASLQAGSRWPHRFYHLASFGSTALLVSLVNRAHARRIAWCASVFLLGCVIERTQATVLAEPMEWWDVRDDAYGVLVLTLAGQLQRVRETLVTE